MSIWCLFGHDWYYPNIRKEEMDIGAAALFLPFLFFGVGYREVCERKCLNCNKTQKVARYSNGNWKKCK